VSEAEDDELKYSREPDDARRESVLGSQSGSRFGYADGFVLIFHYVTRFSGDR
jgi:hypothetical protein